MGSLLFDRVSESRMNRSAVFCLPFGSDGFTQVRIYPVILERGRARRVAGKRYDEICSLLKTLSRPLGTMDWIRAEDHVALDLAPSQRRSRPPRAADPPPIGVEVGESLHGCSAGELPEVVLDCPPPLWFSNDNRFLVTGHYDGTIRLWKLARSRRDVPGREGNAESRTPAP
jgi:hypothetical protein